MSILKDYKQLRIEDANWDYRENRTKNPFGGKVVERVAFCNRGSYDDKSLIILFTDKTFIAVGLEYEDFECRGDLQLTDQEIWSLEGHEDGEALYGCHVDSDGNIYFDTHLQMMVDLGIWDFTEEEAKRIRDEHQKEQEEREYEQYLRLKEKFEKKGE